jgi:hypothetical protein
LEKKGLLVGTLAQSRRREERGEREREKAYHTWSHYHRIWRIHRCR